MSNTALFKITSLIARLQERVTKVGKKTHENTEQISLVRDTAESAFNGLAKRAEEFRVQSFQRDENLAKAFAEINKSVVSEQTLNNDREAKQTLRDHNLANSIQKAFDQVKVDIKNLITRDDRFNQRLSLLEAFQADLLERTKKLFTNPLPTGVIGLPTEHVWVNKKLTGVYSQLDEVEARLKQVENQPTRLIMKNLLNVVSTLGFCTDLACPLHIQNESYRHYFGPGCRFFEASKSNIEFID